MSAPSVKVAQLLYNCPEYLETVYAAFKLRAVPLNVNHRYLADEIVHVLGNADAEVLVFHGSLAGRVEEARARLPRLRAIVQVDDGSPLLDGAHRYDDLVAAQRARAPDRAFGRRTSCCSTPAARRACPRG